MTCLELLQQKLPLGNRLFVDYRFQRTYPLALEGFCVAAVPNSTLTTCGIYHMMTHICVFVELPNKDIPARGAIHGCERPLIKDVRGSMRKETPRGQQYVAGGNTYVRTKVSADYEWSIPVSERLSTTKRESRCQSKAAHPTPSPFSCLGWFSVTGSCGAPTARLFTGTNAGNVYESSC